MFTLVLLRHGQTTWNKEERFTGWTDVPLTAQGIAEAHKAGRLIRQKGFVFDEVHTNVLSRVIETTNIVLSEMGEPNVKIERYWRLNERHYGALQGMTHRQMEEKYSSLQVHAWRRSVYDAPPLLTLVDPRHPAHDKLYADVPLDQIPVGESLADTLKRVDPYIDDVLFPRIKVGKKILVSASNNSLRAIVKRLENMSEIDIGSYTIPTGGVIAYFLDEDLQMMDKEVF